RRSSDLDSQGFLDEASLGIQKLGKVSHIHLVQRDLHREASALTRCFRSRRFLGLCGLCLFHTVCCLRLIVVSLFCGICLHKLCGLSGIFLRGEGFFLSENFLCRSILSRRFLGILCLTLKACCRNGLQHPCYFLVVCMG